MKTERTNVCAAEHIVNAVTICNVFSHNTGLLVQLRQVTFQCEQRLGIDRLVFKSTKALHLREPLLHADLVRNHASFVFRSLHLIVCR